MKKNIILIIYLLFQVLIHAQENKHMVFIISNYNIAIENSIYIDFDDPDIDIWSQPENTFSFGAGYTYALTNYLGIGLQFEGEKITIKEDYLDDFTTSRYAFGIHFQTMYPQTPFHGLGGGYFNAGTGNSDIFDNKVYGIEYGLFIGPGYTMSNFNFAILFRPKFTYYFSSGNVPDSGLLMYPRISLQFGYQF